MRHWASCLALVISVSVAQAVSSANPRVLKLRLKQDDIALVHTAVGIATIIQVPDQPTSVVLGDTNAFKVEYLDTAITIKPLGHSSKSNLYIYTEARRFNVSLVTAPQTAADYIVYLQSERPAKPVAQIERWRSVRMERSNRLLKLSVQRLGIVGDCVTADFTISSKQDLKFRPDWIWITLGGQTVPIQSLTLSGVYLTAKTEINGALSIRRDELKARGPVTLEIRSPKPVLIHLPEGAVWMK